MSDLEDHIRKSIETHGDREKQEEEAIKMEKEGQEASIKLAEKQKEKKVREKVEYEVKRLKNRKYKVFKGNWTEVPSIVRLLTKSTDKFTVKLSDFEYSEELKFTGGGGGRFGGSPDSITHRHLAYKGIQSKSYPCDLLKESAYYFPDWDLTLPVGLLKTIEKAAYPERLVREKLDRL